MTNWRPSTWHLDAHSSNATAWRLSTGKLERDNCEEKEIHVERDESSLEGSEKPRSWSHAESQSSSQGNAVFLSSTVARCSPSRGRSKSRRRKRRRRLRKQRQEGREMQRKRQRHGQEGQGQRSGEIPLEKVTAKDINGRSGNLSWSESDEVYLAKLLSLIEKWKKNRCRNL